MGSLYRSHLTPPLLLLVTGLCFGEPKKQFIDCHSESIATYVESPDKRNSISMLFVPAPGYMDAQGRASAQNKGVFHNWQNFAVQMGYTTIQFDKPGSGSSAGRLNQREEEALLCTYKAIPKINPVYSNKLVLVTYSGGLNYIRYALNAMKKARSATKFLAIVHIAGMGSSELRVDGANIPYLSLLGDTSMTTDDIKKSLLHKKIGGDSLSQIFIMDSVNVNLCPGSEEVCDLQKEVYQLVFSWINKHTQKHYTWVETMEMEENALTKPKYSSEKGKKKEGKINKGKYKRDKEKAKKRKQKEMKKKFEKIKGRDEKGSDGKGQSPEVPGDSLRGKGDK